MNANDFETSNYLNAKSAGKYNGQTLNIYEVTAATINDKRKMLIGFEGVDKQLVVNKTNRLAMQEGYGDDTDAWIGKSVLLSIVLTMFEGKRTPSIMITPTNTQTPIIDADAPVTGTGKRKK